MIELMSYMSPTVSRCHWEHTREAERGKLADAGRSAPDTERNVVLH